MKTSLSDYIMLQLEHDALHCQKQVLNVFRAWYTMLLDCAQERNALVSLKNLQGIDLLSVEQQRKIFGREISKENAECEPLYWDETKEQREAQILFGTVEFL